MDQGKSESDTNTRAKDKTEGNFDFQSLYAELMLSHAIYRYFSLYSPSVEVLDYIPCH